MAAIQAVAPWLDVTVASARGPLGTMALLEFLAGAAPARVVAADLLVLVEHARVQRRLDENEKLGRNDPCWCGSGKKFKKCHGA